MTTKTDRLLENARDLTQQLQDLTEQVHRLAAERRRAVEQLRGAGFSIRQIAAELGVTGGAVQSILRPNQPTVLDDALE